MLAYVVLDNLGYRQLQTGVRAVGTVDFIRRRRGGWGEMKRRGLGVRGAEDATASDG